MFILPANAMKTPFTWSIDSLIFKVSQCADQKFTSNLVSRLVDDLFIKIIITNFKLTCSLFEQIDLNCDN